LLDDNDVWQVLFEQAKQITAHYLQALCHAAIVFRLDDPGADINEVVGTGCVKNAVARRGCTGVDSEDAHADAETKS